MSPFLRNKTISKTTPLRNENPFPQFDVASYKRPGIRLCFEYTTTLLSGEGGEGRIGTATMFRKMLSKCTIFSTVLSKIVAGRSVNRASECFSGAVKSSFQELPEVGFLPETCTLGRPMGKAVREVSWKFLTFKSYMRHRSLDRKIRPWEDRWIRRAAKYFWRTLRFLILWCYTLSKMIFRQKN